MVNTKMQKMQYHNFGKVGKVSLCNRVNKVIMILLTDIIIEITIIMKYFGKACDHCR